MIDVNDLDGLLELANDYVDDGLHFLTEPVSYGDLVILVERIIAAEKDAARYRWLRDNCTTQQADTMGPTFVMTIRRKNNLFNVGLSIDEAMQCSK